MNEAAANIASLRARLPEWLEHIAKLSDEEIGCMLCMTIESTPTKDEKVVSMLLGGDADSVAIAVETLVKKMGTVDPSGPYALLEWLIARLREGEMAKKSLALARMLDEMHASLEQFHKYVDAQMAAPPNATVH